MPLEILDGVFGMDHPFMENSEGAGVVDAFGEALRKQSKLVSEYLGAREKLGALGASPEKNARKELETAADLDPTYADAYFNLAVVCASQKPPDKDAARNAYQKATALGAAPDTRLEELIR
jgi:tetratricopeptide (TPR) repeat protein